MRHISLDESFWRYATEALVSGESIEDVEPSLLDVSRLLHLLFDPARSASGDRIGFLTLGGTGEESALGLTLAALLARRGARVLAADCDFADDTWSRLLGAEEPDGIVDHVAYGVAPARLVRRTSLDALAFLPSGAAVLDPTGVLRSDKLSACLEATTPGHDLVCVGLAFDEELEWGRGVTAGMERAVLLGPAGDELAFELALPKLVRRVEVIATLDVPPLGRWRPALGAALPALVPADRSDDARGELVGASTLSTALHPTTSASPPSSGTNAGSPLEELSLFRPTATAPDGEAAADVAFLQGLARAEPRSDDATGSDRGSETAPRFAARPPLVHPRLKAVALQQQLELAARVEDRPAAESSLRELAEDWRDLDGIDEARTEEAEFGDGDAPGRGFWVTLGSLLLCLALGAAAFWYWRATQRVPEGQFTYYETEPGSAAIGGKAGGGGGEAGTAPAGAAPAAPPARPDGAPARDAGEHADGPGTAPGEAGRAATPEEIGEAPPPVPPATASGEQVTQGMAGGRVEGPGQPGSGAGTADLPGRDAEAATLPEREAGAPAGIGEDGDGAVRAAFKPPTGGPLVPYSLHVGSYQTFEAAERAAAGLRGRGVNAFVTPVLLEGKGEWYRVFAEPRPDAPASEESLAAARAAGAVSEGAVRETPWALYLGSFGEPEQARELIGRLAKSGLSGYALGTAPVHVYAGAFESAGDAEILNRKLRDRGFDSALVRRRGSQTP